MNQGHVMLAVKLVVQLLFAAPAVLIGSTPSNIALSSVLNPSVFGRAVTLVASVTPTAAGGNVTFYEGTNVLGTSRLTGGQVTLTTILLPAGSGLP
jgi:hypothetical protein